MAAWRTGVSLVALIALGCATSATAQAQRASAGQMQGQRSPARIALDIPAQPLDSALAAFGRITGIQMLYDSAVTAGLRSAAVRGTFTPSEALLRLLAPTGLSPRFTGPRTATIQHNPGTQSNAQVNGNTITFDPIVVSGEKVPRDYFRTYTSVGVVTGQEITDYNVVDLQRSFEMLANVRSFKSSGGNNGFVIRGLNSEGVTGPSAQSAPLISVIVDGAIQNTEATRRGARGVWDVQQIEVLRGPQSTIQGRNSLAGAVVIKTNDPTYTPGVIVDGQFGSDSMHSGAFVVNTPLVQDQVALRVAGQTMRQKNGITYVNPNTAVLGEDKLDQVRAKLLVTPSAMPGLKALFTINHTADTPSQNTVNGPDFFARRYDTALSAFPELRRTAANNYIADISYEPSPGWTIQSVTALAKTKTDISGPNAPFWLRDDTRNGTDFSQDLRLTFDRPDSPLSGVVGLFAGRFSFNTDAFSSTTAFGFPVTVQDANFEGKTVSIAAYADLRYRFLDKWTLLAGGRVLRDKTDRQVVGTAFDLGTFTNISLDENVESSNSEFLPKIGLAYDLTPNQTIAGTISKGYRQGYAELVPGSTTLNVVDPEFMWAYELAYRSRWWNDRLQINANVFHYDYKDQQLAVASPLGLGQTITANVGKSHLYGAEFETRIRPVDGLTLFASIGLLKTKFDQAVTASGDFSGNEFPESPSVTASVGGIWKHHSGFFMSADASYTDGYFSLRDLSNDPLRHVSSFILVNAQVGYEMKHGTISVFARNLFDKQYLTSISTPGVEASIGDGRLIGVKGTLRY